MILDESVQKKKIKKNNGSITIEKNISNVLKTIKH